MIPRVHAAARVSAGVAVGRAVPLLGVGRVPAAVGVVVIVRGRVALLQLAALVVGVGHGAVHVGVVVAVVLGRVVRILGGVLVAQILLRKNKSDMLFFSR